MVERSEAFVGIDVAKKRNAMAIAEAGRNGEVRYWGEVDASPEAMRKVIAKLAGKFGKLFFCPENKGSGRRRLRVKRRAA
jgi:transposase